MAGTAVAVVVVVGVAGRARQRLVTAGAVVVDAVAGDLRGAGIDAGVAVVAVLVVVRLAPVVAVVVQGGQLAGTAVAVMVVVRVAVRLRRDEQEVVSAVAGSCGRDLAYANSAGVGVERR